MRMYTIIHHIRGAAALAKRVPKIANPRLHFADSRPMVPMEAGHPFPCNATLPVSGRNGPSTPRSPGVSLMMLRAGSRRFVRVGAHLVEFAFVIPVFFIFIFGLIEIGRGLMVGSLVTNASRAGCRVGILPGKSNSDVTAAVNSLLNAQGVSDYTTTISVNGDATKNVSSASSQDTIKVIVSVPANKVTWLPSALYLNGTISGQFSLPHE